MRTNLSLAAAVLATLCCSCATKPDRPGDGRSTGRVGTETDGGNPVSIGEQYRVVDAIDWPAFLARSDMTWDALPESWEQGAFIGNGLVGAMVYRDGDGSLSWVINRTDVVDRGSRLAIGRMALRTEGRVTGGAMRLDLWNAEITGLVRTDRGSVRFSSYAHARDPVIVVELHPSGGERSCRFEFVGEEAIPARTVYKKEPVPDDTRNPQPGAGEDGEIGYRLQAFTAGGGYALAWGQARMREADTPDTGARVWACSIDAASRTAPGHGAAADLVRATLADDYDALTARHREWWHAWWPTSFVSVPDARLESFYWIQMYKLASATRSDRPAIDLMGPWFRTTPWARIWWNLNIQLTYWPVYASGRLDLGLSLTRMLDSHVDNLAANAGGEYPDAAAIGRASSYDCRSPAGDEHGNLMWALHNYWLQYRYSVDENMLAHRFYPLLRRAVQYYVHIAREGEDGLLHLPEAISPEYPQRAPDTNYDLALFRWGLATAIATAERADIDEPLLPQWRRVQDRLSPFCGDPATGYMIGRGVPLARSHRHFSHLLMVYPLHLVDPEDGQQRGLIETSLAHWIGFEGALQGYSFTGAAAMNAWLGHGDRAHELLDEFLARFVKPNTMYLEAGPVIETPLSAAASLHEMLLQSWSTEPFGTHIRVFPAVPDSWGDVSFHRMAAEGGFRVSAVRRGGRTRFVMIESLAGAPCRVRSGLASPVRASGARPHSVEEGVDSNGHPVQLVDISQGETVILYSGDDPPSDDDLRIAAVDVSDRKTNWFGSPRSPIIEQRDDDTFVLEARDAGLHGLAVFYEKTREKDNIGRWIRAGDWVSWEIDVQRPGEFTVLAEYAATGSGAIIEICIDRTGVQGQRKTVSKYGFRRVATGSWTNFVSSEVGRISIPSAGRFECVVRSGDGQPPMINLKRITLVPAGE